MNEEQWRRLRRAEMGLAAASDPEQQIRALTGDIQRFQQIARRTGLSAEGRRLLARSAEQRLDEATALRYGRPYAPKGNRGQREVRTVSCVYAIEENKRG